MASNTPTRRVFLLNVFGDVGVLPKGKRSLIDFDTEEAKQVP